MNCPICKGPMEARENKLGTGGIRFESFKCSKCGEDLVFESSFNELMDDVIKFKKEQQYTKAVAQSGNSLVLRIPAKLAKSMSIKEGSKMRISPVAKGFVAELA